MGEFVEKYLGRNWRKNLFRTQSGSIFDIPTELHTLKSESLTEQKEDELAENS